MAWLNLTMLNQTVNNSLKDGFFLEKQLIKFSCTYQPLSFCKILKKFLEPNQSYEDVPFSGPKWPICPEQNFFGINHYYCFHLPTGPFHCAKFKKNLTVDTELWGCTNLVSKMVHLPQTNFFWKIINIILIYLLALSLCKIFKNFFLRIQSYGDAPCLSPKWSISPNENFFRKPVNEPCFFHSCLSTCQKSKSDINLLVKYWRLKNTEISLAKSHFWL